MGEIIVGEYIIEWDDAKNKITKKSMVLALKMQRGFFLTTIELMTMMNLTAMMKAE